VGDLCVLLEQRRVHPRVLLNAHRALGAVGREDQAQPAAFVLGGEVLLLVARRQASGSGHEPDLKEVHGLAARGVLLAVHHAAASAHSLHVAGADHRAVAHVVFVLQGALEHVGDDLHVAVPVGGEAAAGANGVVVDHPQGPEAHVLWVVVVGEGERVVRVEPAVVGVPAVFCFAEGQHRAP
jgi:hypothetical protein